MKRPEVNNNRPNQEYLLLLDEFQGEEGEPEDKEEKDLVA